LDPTTYVDHSDVEEEKVVQEGEKEGIRDGKGRSEEEKESG
jgi:hypothetical protein